MANRQNTFLLKRSNVSGKIPLAGDLQLGELALNTADVVLYASGTTANSILPIGWDRVARTGDTMTGTLYAPTVSAATLSATTYLNLPAFSGDYLPLSGGTVYGNSYFTNGLTADTLNVTGLTQTSGITSTGGITFKQVTINSAYTATTSDYMIDVSGGTFTVTLPSAVGIQGRLLVIKNNGGGAVTVQTILGQNIDDKPFVILGETNSLQLASNGSNWVALGYNISTVNSSTGVFEFSGLSKVTSTTFRVAPVKGWIVNDTTNPLSPQLFYISYSGGVHTDDYVTTAYETFIYLTSGGTIAQQTTPLTPTQRRINIFLGKLGHPDKTTINLVFSQPDFVLSPLAQLRDVFTPINLINGGVYPSTNTGLTFNTSAGYLYGLGINFASDTLNPNAFYNNATNPCTFQYRTQTGGTITNVTNIDPLNYDVNGTITPITGTKATNQRIYLLQNGTFRVQYGQHTYNNLVDAISALQTETFTPFPNFVNNAVLIGILTVLSTATDLTDTSKAQFFFASKFGETIGAAGGISTTTLQQAYNNSINPEITTNSILNALSIKNGAGSADNITNLIEGLNTAGNTTSLIRADGYISGTTFQSNGFRANNDGITATTVSATTLTTPSFTANTNGVVASTVNGVYVSPYVTIGAAYTATTANSTIEISGGTFTLTLYTAVGNSGRTIYIKNSGSGIVTVDANASETIDGQLRRPLGTFEDLLLQSNGANWVILNRKPVVMQFSHDSQSVITPADATTYYIGNFVMADPATTSGATRQVIALSSGWVRSATLMISVAGTLATSGNSTFSLKNVTTGADSIISSTVAHTSAAQLLSFTLATPMLVTKGDLLQINWRTPTWTTNPSSVRQALTILVE